jgi:hypothetical protein
MFLGNERLDVDPNTWRICIHLVTAGRKRAVFYALVFNPLFTTFPPIPNTKATHGTTFAPQTVGHFKANHGLNHSAHQVPSVVQQTYQASRERHSNGTTVPHSGGTPSTQSRHRADGEVNKKINQYQGGQTEH